jgi:ribosomal protein S18 acetylase RimI-like enzyme
VTDSAAGPSDKLKRERSGTYRTADGRFTVEQTSSGWLMFDAEQVDELGLPLARGPFATLDAARVALGAARTSRAPDSRVGARTRVPATTARTSPGRTATGRPAPVRPGAASARAQMKLAPSGRPPIVIREIRAVDGDALRSLWRDVGFHGLGDDDRSLARLARRNPGLVLVAAQGSRIVGSALGAWDGRRGWIYHVATAQSHRRQGIAQRLIDQIEAGLVSLGCPKVNVIVRPDSDGGAEFWAARGYGPAAGRQYGKELEGE